MCHQPANQLNFQPIFFLVEFILGNRERISLIIDDNVVVIKGICSYYHASLAALPDSHGQKESQIRGSNSKSNIHYV